MEINIFFCKYIWKNLIYFTIFFLLKYIYNKNQTDAT